MYNAPECGYRIEGMHIVTDKSVAKKVTGTSMAGILNCSPWKTPFQVACELLGLAREDISYKKSVKRGQFLEPKIIEYADKKWCDVGTFLSAEEVFKKREGDHDSWASDFEDDVFAGHVDGLVLKDNGDYILEIKTTINTESWENGVPEYYYWQVAIYNYFLTQKDRVYFVLGVSSEEADKNPAVWVPTDDNCFIFEEPIDEDDVQGKITEIRDWYEAYIRNGVTPDYDPTNAKDIELYNHLVRLTSNAQQRDKMMMDLATAEAELETKRYTYGIDALEEQIKSMKDNMKDLMVSNNINEQVDNARQYKATITQRTIYGWDEGKMIADGIDPSKYKTEKTTYAFSFKPTKKK